MIFPVFCFWIWIGVFNSRLIHLQPAQQVVYISVRKESALMNNYLEEYERDS